MDTSLVCVASFSLALRNVIAGNSRSRAHPCILVSVTGHMKISRRNAITGTNHRRIHVLKSGGSAGRGSGGRSPPAGSRGGAPVGGLGEAEGFLSEEDQYFCAFC